MRILIHGASSWIGHYVVKYIGLNYPKAHVFGTYRNPAFKPKNVESAQVTQNSDCLNHIREFKPEYFLNLSRGESDSDFTAHMEIIQALENLKAHYSYASSFNACDNQLTEPHFESEKPGAQSDYGKFKARCEVALETAASSFSIFRFGSIQGWAPSRATRTEAFLQKLQAKEEVSGQIGVLQNRPYVGDLAGMIIDATLNKGQGVFHYGTTDCSNDVEYGRQLAETFGYSKTQVTEDGAELANACMMPQKIFDMFGDKWRRSEADTLATLADSEHLQRYKK